MSRLLVACFLVGSAFSQVDAATLVVMHEPTITEPGTLSVFAVAIEPGESFRGVDADFRAVEGRFNQELGDFDTPFADFNAFMGDVSLDTQFTFRAGDILSIGVMESSENLKGAISGIARLGITDTVIPFAQISTPRVAEFTYDLAFDVGVGPDPVKFSGRIFLVPEPISELLAAVAALGCACVRRRA